jgi:hypothetical protein
MREALRRDPAVAPLINGQAMASTQEQNLTQRVVRTMSVLKSEVNKLIRILKRHLPY